ncbi:MAG: septation protein IspZ, partial [Rhizomicrobium sp.]
MNPQLRKLALDMGPLFIFFVAFEFSGIFFATGIFMIAALTSVALGWHFEKKLSPIPVLTAILVLIAGGLTLYLRNDVFIKMKPTGLYIIFGVTLLGGLCFNRLFIKYV